MPPHSKNAGFTLIELSIVLLFIALIRASILVGRDLIRTAQLRAAIGQIESLNTALNTFKLKYNCIAGDCASATAVGVGSHNGQQLNGNGNGVIDFVDPPSLNHDECIYVVIHLKNAGLYESPKANVWPLTKFGNGVIEVAFEFDTGGLEAGLNKDGHAYWVLIDRGVVSPGRHPPLFAPQDAWYIDNKMDDSMPYSGVFTVSGMESGDISVIQLPYNPSEGPAGGDFCVNTDTVPPSYNNENSKVTCSGLYRFM